MKLIDFSKLDTFKKLLNQMDSKLDKNQVNHFHNFHWSPLEEFHWNLDHAGVDIIARDIDIGSDNTLEYRGFKIVVYIRDNFIYEKDLSRAFPKFHISYCTKLKEMRVKNKNDRYVASRERSMIFRVLINGKEYKEKLNICRYCLTELNYHNYRNTTDLSRKNQIVDNFDLSLFFKNHDNILWERPLFDEHSSPINQYTPDFKAISYQLRSSKKWVCEICKIDLTAKKYFLHVHHVDGNRANNFRDNLLCLCIGCHSDQPDHEHMKRTDELKRYYQWKDLN